MSDALTIGETVDTAEYHRRPGISTSRLNVFLRDVREYDYQFNSGLYVPKSEHHFDFGSAVHELTLLRDASNLAVIPSSVLSSSGSRAGGKWKDWLAQQGGKIVLKQHEYDAVKRCVDAVMRHPVASVLLASPGPAEKAFSFYDENLELDWRCKVDKLCQMPSGWVVADLKTTGKSTVAGSFVRSVADFRYHHQEYIYRKILGKCGIELSAFVFIAVSVEQPHTVDCYSLSREFIELAERVVENAAMDLAERIRANDWQPRTFNSIVELSPPNYLKYLSEYEV